MRPRPRLFAAAVLALVIPSVVWSQSSPSLTQDQLEQRIAALEPFACDASDDARAQNMRSALLDYKRQLKTTYTNALKDPGRLQKLDALSAADKDLLTRAWADKIAKLDTVCPTDLTARSAPTAAPQIRVKPEAQPLAEKALGVITTDGSTDQAASPTPAAAATTPAAASAQNVSLVDKSQEVIRGMAAKRAESFSEISAEPMELIFARQDVATESAPQSVTITNKSGKDLFLISAEVPGKNYTLVENLCATKLPNDGKCTMKVAFLPFNSYPQDMLSSLLIRFTDQTDGTNPRDFPITLRGSAIHWKFPFTRAVAGLDVSAVSSKPTNFHYFVEFNLTAPTDRFFKQSNKIDPLESRTWVFLNPRITSVPTTSSAVDNLNPSLDSFNSLVTSNLTKVGQGVDVNLGLELALLKPRSGIAWWSDFPNSHAKLAISAVFAGGAITPFSSDKTQQSATLNQSIVDAFPGFGALLPAGCLDTNGKLTTTCPDQFVTFLTPERSRFFRKYYTGLRFKTFFFNEDVPGECWDSKTGKEEWRKRHPHATCSAPYNIFPGTFDITIGQDESVTGGSAHGLVWRMDAVYPLHFLPSLHVFGSVYGTFQKNQNSRPFQLVQPGPNDTLNDSNTLRFLVPIQNRDYYRIGLGVDLVQLFKKNDAGQPDTALTPKDTAKTASPPATIDQKKP